jgi:hypothetical protein
MQFVLIVCFLLSIPILLSDQESSQPKAVASRRLVRRGEMYHPLQEIYLDLEGSAGNPGDMIAMRICSREPLPLAMFLAVVSPIGRGEMIAKEGLNGKVFFTRDRIIILRSPDCPVTHPPYVPLEFWGVPRGAALPPFVESAKLCQVRIEGVDSDEDVKNLRAYRASLKEILAKVRANPEAVAIVRGEYNVRPSASIRRALREAERFFGRSGLPQKRYFVRLKPSAYYDPEYNREPEPKYPTVVAVRIAPNCNGE